MNENEQFVDQSPVDNSIAPISWTASEFIAHDKDPKWYGMLALWTFIVTAVIFLVTRDPIASGAVIVVALFFGVYAARQPRQLPYQLDQEGLDIGSRFYDLRQFRSFAVVPEGAFSSIILMPLKRFSPITTIYYPPDDEDAIIEILSAELPYVEHRHDAIDRLMRHIRF